MKKKSSSLHGIKKLFGKIASTYDSERKALIPCFDEFYAVIVELAETKNKKPNILDIGAGTGLLTQMMLAKYPHAGCTLIDISEEMLSVAKKRLSDYKKINYIAADYEKYDFTEKFDLVVSSLSIHHLPDTGKAALYDKIYNLLEDPGIFVAGDQFAAPSHYNEKIYQANWIKKIESSELTKARKKGAYERMKFDKPAAVEDNLIWLANAGFKSPDVYYKYYNFGVIAGRK